MAMKRPRRRARKVTGAKPATSPRRTRRAPTRADRAPAARLADQTGPITAIVGLGSSAGGLDALKRFFGAMPADSGMAFVLVQHLDPTHGSLMAELLGRCTAMPVVQVEADTPVEGDHVYCIPPGRYLSIDARTLRLTAPVETGSVRMPIDFFLRSLAADAQERAIGIVLVRHRERRHARPARDQGGRRVGDRAGPRDAPSTMACRAARSPPARSTTSCRPSRMPASSSSTSGIRTPAAASGSRRRRPIGRDHLTDALAIVRDRTKFDFRSYKRSTLERRIGRRMGLKHVERVADYARLLTDEPAEVARAVRRPPDQRHELLPRPRGVAVAPGAGDSPVGRADGVPTPRCACGCPAARPARRPTPSPCCSSKSCTRRRRAGSHADLRLGRRRGRARVRARRPLPGEHRRRRAAGAPATLLRRGGPRAFVSAKELRESVVFARQNLRRGSAVLQARPDLLPQRPHVPRAGGPEADRARCCTSRWSRTGTSFLGTAETIGQQEDLFEAVSKKWRIYRRVGPTRHDQRASSRPCRSPRSGRRAARRRAARASAGSARSPSSCCSSASSRRAW